MVENYNQTEVLEIAGLLVIAIIVIFMHSLFFMLCAKYIDIFNIKLSTNIKVKM